MASSPEKRSNTLGDEERKLGAALLQKENENAQLMERLGEQATKLNKLQNDQLKLLRVLKRETGADSLEDLAENENWRGRAEQLELAKAALKTKQTRIAELEHQLASANDQLGFDADEIRRECEKSARAAFEA